LNASLLLIISACFFLAIGVPVAFALGLATAATLILAENYPLFVLLKETFTGIDSFPLMAVPFFILAAELMSGGSLTEVLLRFAGQFVSHKRGGLGYTNVVSLTFFSGISGSALADAAGPGSMLIRMMDKAGYDRSYAAALTAATAIVGPIIPPSIIMIIYGLQDDNVSVGALFVAGLLPGILIAVAMCVVNFHVSKKRNYRGDGGMPPWPEVWRTTWKAIPALLLPVLILGGMRAGWFTPTEASVVAVFYALVCGKFVYRTLEWKALPDILARSALLTASALIIIGLSASFAWILTIEGLPQLMADWIIGMNLSPWMFLIIVNVFFAAVRHFYRATARRDGVGADSCARCGQAGHRPHPFCDDRHLQPHAGHDHAAGGGPVICHIERVACAHGPAGAGINALPLGTRCGAGAADFPACPEHLAAPCAGLQIALKS